MMPLTQDRQRLRHLFWTLNVAGWGLLSAVYLFIFNWRYLNQPKQVVGLLITEFCGFLATVGLREIYRRLRYQDHSIFSLFLIVLLYSVVLANGWYGLDLLVSLPIIKMESFHEYVTPMRWFGTVYSQVSLLVAWSAFYFAIKLWLDWTVQRRRAEDASRLAQQAQLQMLRYQLNPHFLFNALNSIRALIDENGERARLMVTELAEFLRYSLVCRGETFVPLRNELEAIGHYFTIQKIRHEDRLDITVDVDDRAKEFPVLCFLVHPLIENAVKYGMETSPIPVRIRLRATVVDETLTIEVANTGHWVQPDESGRMGTGTGLKNVRQRLANAFPNAHRFDVREESGWVRALLEIRKPEESYG